MEISGAERGTYLRQVRKKAGKNIEDFTSEQISKATISNIETNREPVSEEKVRLYCSLLKVDYDRLPEYIRKHQHEEAQKDKEYLNYLRSIEDIILYSKPKIGLKKLKRLKQYPAHFESMIYYLKGVCYIKENNQFNKAKNCFLKAIDLAQRYKKTPFQNFASHCYNQLGHIAYFQNDFEQALKYTEQGLDVFVGEKSNIWFSLQTNKVVYLEKLNNIADASEILSHLWSYKDKIKNIEIILNLHDLQGIIYSKKQMFYDGINIIKEGLKLSRMNYKANRTIELWTTLGSIFMEIGACEKAKNALTTAIEVGHQAKLDHLTLSAQIKLGKLYTLRGEFDLAKKQFDRVLTYHGKVNVSKIIETHISLGDSFFQQQKVHEAIQHYNQALQYAQKHELLFEENETLRKLCMCWEPLDKQKFLNYVVSYYHTDLALKQKGADQHAARR